jgi:hypothetical protein
MVFDISAEVEDLIDAAIDCEVLRSPGMQGFLKQGGYYVFHSATGGGTMILPGRGAPAPDISEASAPSVEALDPGSWTIDGQTASELYAKWETRIYELFHPYETMPRPEDFQFAVDSFDPVLEKLAINPEAFPNAEGDGEDPLDFEVTGNDEFTLVASASTQFAIMQGLTADAFRKYYLDRFPLVTQRQYAVAQMLKAAVVGEQQVWARLQVDVPTLVRDATRAFERGGQNSGGSSPDLSVAGVIAGVAALIPPLAAAAGAASAFISVLSVIPPAEGDHHTYTLAGSTAEELWSSLVGASDDIKAAAADQERALGEHMDRIQGLVHDDPGKFDLGRIEDGYGPTDQSAEEELNAETDPTRVIGVLNVNYDIVISTGQDLIDVATVFDQAAGMVNGALESGAWSRPGGIGWGYTGHFEQTAGLAQSLVDILRGTYTGLTNAGQVIQLVARQLRDGDSDVAADLRERQDRLALAGSGQQGG